MMFRGPTWSRHAPPNSDWVFAAPLVNLLLHLLHLSRIEGPQAAFTGRASVLVLHLFKALVQREVVSHRVLPSVRSCLRTGRGEDGTSEPFCFTCRTFNVTSCVKEPNECCDCSFGFTSCTSEYFGPY